MEEGYPEEIAEIHNTLRAILHELRPDEETEQLGVLQLAYPNDGTKAALGVGVTDLNYEQGTVKKTDGSIAQMSSSLEKHLKPHMQTVAIKADADIVVQFDGHDKFPVDSGEWFQADDYEFKRLRITTTGATNAIVLTTSSD